MEEKGKGKAAAMLQWILFNMYSLKMLAVYMWICRMDPAVINASSNGGIKEGR